QQERLDKAQRMVMERDRLPISNLINNEFYFEEEEDGEVNNGDNTDSEQLNISNINTTSKTLRPIKDCPTRWNSTYRSWERLLKLKDAIIWLEANLKISQHSDDKKDELVKIFEPFDQATEAFSAEKYPTLSVVYPIIEVLKSEFAADPNLTLIEEDLNEEYDSDSDSEEVQILEPHNIQTIIAQ
ncbi:14326_t:CDS:2, partial [Cetraspora pellucida]